MAMTITGALIAIALGFGIGLISGLFGVGGGGIMITVFRVLLDMTALQAGATSLFCIILTSLTGSVARIKNKMCVPQIGVAVGIGGCLTAPVGVVLAEMSPSWLITIMTAVLVSYSTATVFVRGFSKKKPPEPEDAAQKDAQPANQAAVAEGTQPASQPAVQERVAVPEDAQPVGQAAIQGGAQPVGQAAIQGGAQPTARENAQPASQPIAQQPTAREAANQDPSFAVTKKSLLIGAAVGLLAGVCAGYIGLGGGFIIIPFLLNVLHMSFKDATGTSLLAVMFIAIPGVITHAFAGDVLFFVGLMVAIGTLPGSILGAKIAKRCSDRRLCQIFSFVNVFMIAGLLLKEFGVL